LVEVLFKRINFESIMQYCMTKPRQVAYLKAKLYLLIQENISNFMEKTSEEMIVILHRKYCSNKSTNTTADTATPSHLEYKKESTHQEIIDLIDISSDDEDEYDCIDLTHFTGDDDFNDNAEDVGDSDENDFVNEDDDVMIVE